jgi:hypothetical protein
MGAAAAFLDGLVLTPAVKTGARTSPHALGWPPFAGTTLVRRWPLSLVLRWSPPLVRLPTTEVVASAGETVRATCRRAPRLFGFNGLVVAPVGGRGEDLLALALTLRWSLLLASGSERRSLSLLVQRWSLSPVIRRCRGGHHRW